VGIDGSSEAILAAMAEEPAIPVCVADAATLPFEDGSFDLVVAFMSLQDVNDLAGAVEGAARVLEPGGRLCLAIVHPINSAGEFEDLEAGSRFVISGSYLQPSFYEDDIAHDGMQIVFASAHRPLQTYAEALSEAGFAIERLREVTEPDQDRLLERRKRWQRVPLFLHIRAVKLPQSSSR
jgi:SAM-dependent methyltransferase